MSEYVPSPAEWVRDQVELYESTNGAEGAEMRGMPVVIVTHRGRRSGAVRKTPLMRVADGDGYVLVGSLGGAPQNPVWVHNLLADPDVEIRDRSTVQAMRAPRSGACALAWGRPPRSASGCGASPSRPIPTTRPTRRAPSA